MLGRHPRPKGVGSVVYMPVGIHTVASYDLCFFLLKVSIEFSCFNLGTKDDGNSSTVREIDVPDI